MFSNFLEDEKVRSGCENDIDTGFESGIINECGSICDKEAICGCHFLLLGYLATPLSGNHSCKEQCHLLSSTQVQRAGRFGLEGLHMP